MKKFLPILVLLVVDVFCDDSEFKTESVNKVMIENEFNYSLNI